MSGRTQITLRPGRHLLTVAVLIVLAGIPTLCASQAKQTPNTAEVKQRLLVAAALSLELAALAERSERGLEFLLAMLLNTKLGGDYRFSLMQTK